MSRRPIGILWAALLFSLLASSCVFVRRVSLDSGGSEIAQATQVEDLSADGRFALVSTLGAFVAADTNNSVDLYRKDLVTGEMVLVTVPDSGGVSNTIVTVNGEMSDDGRFVAFESTATNLVANDTNGAADIFLRDVQAGTTVRVSESTGGTQAAGQSTDPAISADGAVVAFVSNASNLVGGDTNFVHDVFAHVVTSGETVLVSRSAAGVLANGTSLSPSVNGTGSQIAFQSSASNLVAGMAGNQIYVKAVTGAIDIVSVTSGGLAGNNTSDDPVISASGDVVAFRSLATNFLTPDVNPSWDVFLRDRNLGVTVLAGLMPGGGQPPGPSVPSAATISADGDHVSWLHTGSVYVSAPILGYPTVALPLTPSGSPVAAFRPVLSADGRYAAYTTSAPVVAGDTNAVADVYVVAWREPAPSAVTPAGAAPGQTVAVSISGSGFEPGLTAFEFGSQLSFANVVVSLDGTSITADMTVSPTAVVGSSSTVSIQNPDGGPGVNSGSFGVCAGCVTILP